MGLLFIATNIDAPSHRWMRRQLDGLAGNISCLAIAGDAPPRYSSRCPCVWLGAPPGYISRALRHAGVRIDSTERESRRLRRLVDATDVSCVLVHFLTVAVQLEAVWNATARPVFVHCHGYDVTWNQRSKSHIGQPVHPENYVAQVLALPGNVQFIANSQETCRRLTEIGVSRQRIHVKYMGVEVPTEPPVRHVTPGPLNILFVGRLVDCKGPDLLIRAFERACSRGLDATLTIVGDGALRCTCELLRARSKYGHQIFLLGALGAEAVAQLMRNADIFSAHNCVGPLTNQEEAFGVAIVEAMAAGVPIVSGRSGALPELIQDNEQGVLVEPGDIDAHADALLALAKDTQLRLRMGRNAWCRAREMFSVGAEISRLREILALPQVPGQQLAGSPDRAGRHELREQV